LNNREEIKKNGTTEAGQREGLNNREEIKRGGTREA
jgi:hypothetical protein